MPKEPSISPDILRQLLTFSPITGDFSWERPKRDWFVSDAHWFAYNAERHAAAPFSTPHSGGYLWGQIGREQLLAHRVAWAYCHGVWPDEQIDHINHDKTDNRVVNLRLAPQAENAKNAGRRSDNTSGYTGVYWNKDRKKWVAQIGLPGPVTKPLGRYALLADAIAARKAAEEKYGFHPNHGSDPSADNGGEA